MQTVSQSVDGVLPAAAISGSLPWRSASSHWYNTMDEPHAETHGAKQKQKNGSNVNTNAHTEKELIHE